MSSALSGQIFLPAGITADSPVNIQGHGSGSGPGAVTDKNTTRFIATFSNGDVITDDGSLFGSMYQDFQINSDVGNRASGAGLRVDKTAVNSAGAHTIVDNVSTNSQHIGLSFHGTVQNIITRTYHQNWVSSAVSSTGDGANETGLGYFSFNYLRGDTEPSTAQYYGLNLHDGYHAVTGNLILGSRYGLFNVADVYDNGAPIVMGNWFEENDRVGIYVTGTNGKKSSMGAWSNNEISAFAYSAASRTNYEAGISLGSGGPVDWMTCFQTNENRFRYNVARSDATCINLQSGTGGQISGNLGEGLSQNTMKGIYVGSNARNVDIFDNKFFGTWSGKYTLTAECMLRDYSSRLTAAEVSAITAHDGSTVWAEDGVPHSNPLTGGGSGCEAYRLGGIWRARDSVDAATVVNTDANYTVPEGVVILKHTGTLTANRTITLPSGARELRVTRTGAGSFLLNLGSLKNLPAQSWAVARRDASGWYLAEYGSLI